MQGLLYFSQHRCEEMLLPHFTDKATEAQRSEVTGRGRIGSWRQFLTAELLLFLPESKGSASGPG